MKNNKDDLLAKFHESSELALIPGRRAIEIQFKLDEMTQILSEIEPVDNKTRMELLSEFSEVLQAFKYAKQIEGKRLYVHDFIYSISADLFDAINDRDMEFLKHVTDSILDIRPYSNGFDGFREEILNFISTNLKHIQDICHEQALIENNERSNTNGYFKA